MAKYKIILFFICSIHLVQAKSQNNSDELIHLQLKWHHSWQFAGIYAAQKQGYFKQYQLNVKLLPIPVHGSYKTSVLQYDAEYGISDASLVLARMQQQPVVLLSVIFQQSPLVLMSLAQQQIFIPADIKDKRLMIQGNEDDAAISALLKQLNIKDYQAVKHNRNDNALVTGYADIMSAYLTDQVINYRQAHQPVNVIYPSAYGINFFGDALFTTEQEVKQHPKRVKQMIQAINQGWSYALSHKQEMSEWIIAQKLSKLPIELLLAQADAIERMVKPELIPIGTIDTNKIKEISKVYKQLGYVSEQASYQGLLVTEYMASAEQLDNYLNYLVIAVVVIVLLLILHYWARIKLKHIIKAHTQALYERATKDYLTQLENRQSLDQQLLYWIEQAKRYQEPFSLIMLDIDHFKRVNDRYGHLVGDVVLKQLSQLLQQHTRSVDIVGRWGGEEFIIICPKLVAEQAYQLAEKLRQKVANFAFDTAGTVTISLGVSHYLAQDDTHSLIRHVDQALYQAKAQGRNKVVLDEHIANDKRQK